MKIPNPVSLLLPLVITTNLCDGQSATPSVSVKSFGTINGHVVSYNNIGDVDEFLGIPYAEPPVGDLRFSPTKSLTPRSVVLNATHFRNDCFQRRGNVTPVAWSHPSERSTSEDCLYLNIWRPSGAAKGNKKLSVMIWVHGGAWRMGGSSMDEYYPGVLAVKENVILVSINYRLGSLGFLYGGKDTSVKGNMGLYDILESVKWVKKNIGAFGGDGNSITLFGESAGSCNVNHIAASPSSKGLVKRVILQSCTSNNPMPAHNNQGPITYKCMLEYLGCTEATAAQCIRTQPAESILNAELHCVHTHQITSLPIIDGVVVADSGASLLSKKKLMSHLDVLIGDNDCEGCLFPYSEWFRAHKQKFTDITQDQADHLINGILHKLTPEQLQEIHAKYSHLSPVEKVKTVLSYSVFSCPHQYLAESACKSTNVYFYHWSYRPSHTVLPEWMGATHTTEIRFVMGHPFLYPLQYDDLDRSVSTTMMSSFANFAKTGKPSATWGKFTSTDRQYMYISADGKFTMKKGVVYEADCNFLRSYLGSK